MSQKLIVITGPTASGKTSLAVQLAYEISGEIISADSRQVYRGLDIGSGKDLDEYKIKDVEIPHHLIDIRDPGDKYDLFNFKKDFNAVYNQLSKSKTPTILCGGSGLYIEAVLNNYQMLEVPHNRILRNELEEKSMEELVVKLKSYGDLHNTSDITDRTRTIRAIEIAAYQRENSLNYEYPRIEYAVYAINYPRIELRERIAERLQLRLDQGMVEEVKGLLKAGIQAETLKYYGLEYKFTTMFILGELSESEFIQKLTGAIQKFAKRQMTWFRRMEKRGIKINWLDGALTLNQKVQFIINNEQR